MTHFSGSQCETYVSATMYVNRTIFFFLAKSASLQPNEQNEIFCASAPCVLAWLCSLFDQW